MSEKKSLIKMVFLFRASLIVNDYQEDTLIKNKTYKIPNPNKYPYVFCYRIKRFTKSTWLPKTFLWYYFVSGLFFIEKVSIRIVTTFDQELINKEYKIVYSFCNLHYSFSTLLPFCVLALTEVWSFEITRSGKKKRRKF